MWIVAQRPPPDTFSFAKRAYPIGKLYALRAQLSELLVAHDPGSNSNRLTTEPSMQIPDVTSSRFDLLLLLGLEAHRHDVDHRHMTKVGIVGAVEPFLLDESLKIVDVRLPPLGVVE